MKQMKVNTNVDKGCYIAGWCVLILISVCALALKITGFPIGNYMPPCMFHAVTGYYCPGCGGTRAAFALIHGKFIQSFYYHPIVLYTAIAGGWFMISQTIEWISGKRVKIGMHFREIYLWIALGIILIHFLVRNLALVIWQTDLLA